MTTISPERFAEGLTLHEYIRSIVETRAVFERNYAAFDVDTADVSFLRKIAPHLKVLVLAEEWCGDVLRYLPVLAHLAEDIPSWEVRVFARDENLDLADMWLKEGKFRSIPVMVFFDEQMNELACYVERPAAVYADERSIPERFADEYPDLPDATYPQSEMSETTAEMYTAYMRKYRQESATRWQQLFVNEIKAKLSASLCDDKRVAS